MMFFICSDVWLRATAIFSIISSMVSLDSSVSASRRLSGMSFTASSLNFSPIEMYMSLSLMSCFSTLQFERKPCIIQAILGLYSRCRVIISLLHRTQCRIRGLLSVSESSMCLRNKLVCIDRGVSMSESSPVSPMAATLSQPEEISRTVLKAVSAVFSSIPHGCMPTEYKRPISGLKSLRRALIIASALLLCVWQSSIMALDHIRFLPKGGNGKCV